MKTSYGEILCRGLLKRWFPNEQVIYNYRPTWLKNQNTGRNLELDIFYPNLKLAIEFNGLQHRFLLQRRKDYFKIISCKKLGVILLNVEKPLDLFKFKGLIKRTFGIKIPQGNSDKEFLCKLRMYDPSNTKSSWYEKAKEESFLVESKRDEKKKENRKLKVDLRRDLKRSLRQILVEQTIFTKNS